VNYPEQIWLDLKRGVFPSVSGEEEKRLKIAFFQGIHSGRTLVIQGLMTLRDNEMVKFGKDLNEQISGALSQLGQKPGKIKVYTDEPNTIVRINGEKI
jgi:hypothetical protein